jgi:hypothetical protein
VVKEASKPLDVPHLWVIAIFILGGCFLFVAIASLVAALAFRGGVLRILGLEVVTPDGRAASRLRVLARTCLTWLPLLLAFAAIFGSRAAGVPISGTVFASGVALGLLVIAVAGIVAVRRPERGIQDRLAGTWIVPR